MYRLTGDLIGIFSHDGHKVVRIIKQGTMLSVDSQAPENPRLILVTWKDQPVTVFRADLEERSELVFLP